MVGWHHRLNGHGFGWTSRVGDGQGGLGAEVLGVLKSWTIKKAEHRRIDAFELWCLKKTLESPLDCKEIQPAHPKGDQS